MSNTYKIAIVGFGSIGKRHFTNISKVLSERGENFSIDVIRHENRTIIEQPLADKISRIYIDTEEVPDDYDVIFITNPTHAHFDSILKYINKTKHLFIEKPLSDKTSVDISVLPFKEDSIYYVACPLRYTNTIQYIKNELDLSKVYSARAICSSYLPDWRPEQDYRKVYSSQGNKGGGVTLDLIHEWDYLIYLFGLPKQVLNLRGKFSQLEIDSDDLSVYIAEYNNMLMEVHLDYLGRKPIRELHLLTSEDTIVADIIRGEVRFLKDNKVLSLHEDRDSYQAKEIHAFFDMIEGKKENENDIQSAFNTLKVAKGEKVG